MTQQFPLVKAEVLHQTGLLSVQEQSSSGGFFLIFLLTIQLNLNDKALTRNKHIKVKTRLHVVKMQDKWSLVFTTLSEPEFRICHMQPRHNLRVAQTSGPKMWSSRNVERITTVDTFLHAKRHVA